LSGIQRGCGYIQVGVVPAHTVTHLPPGGVVLLLLTLLTSSVACLCASPADWLVEFPVSDHWTDSEIEMLPVIS
jgi:hypothetical protein